MAIPKYTYLEMKMPGPGRVITISTSFRRAYEWKVECCDHTAAIVASIELTALKKEVAEEAPDPKQATRSFELVEGSKKVLVDPRSTESKMVRIGTTLSSK
ncbi:uncharacterized protein [Miscanthus floridulus]|uniref:uncharacterized protein n=1 Tax=Miscanthus floridulus TaxID=154761 RepID=UPI003458A02E